MRVLLVVVLLVIAAAASAQEEGLWMPDGYRLLSLEERQELSPEQTQSIAKTNSKLLEEAVRKMTAEERQAVATRLSEYGQSASTTQVEKQYITMASMLVMALAMEEHNQQQKQAEADRVKALILEAEEKTKGFASDQKSVEQEAFAVEAERRRRVDARKLYLRILPPRSWRVPARVALIQKADAGRGSNRNRLRLAA